MSQNLKQGDIVGYVIYRSRIALGIFSHYMESGGIVLYRVALINARIKAGSEPNTNNKFRRIYKSDGCRYVKLRFEDLEPQQQEMLNTINDYIYGEFTKQKTSKT